MEHYGGEKNIQIQDVFEQMDISEEFTQSPFGSISSDLVRKMGRIGRIFSNVYITFVYYTTTHLGQKPKMRIIEEVKLDFNDVLIKPKRSTLISQRWNGSGNSNSDIQIEIGKVFLYYPTWITQGH